MKFTVNIISLGKIKNVYIYDKSYKTKVRVIRATKLVCREALELETTLLIYYFNC